mgnify:CR=1 FL=1|tara:strand:- start:1332 stop:2372 length:1041 start_codon:yes stop_codon:yes gene_type:complete
MSFTKKRKIYTVDNFSDKQLEKLDRIYDRMASKSSTNVLPGDAGIMHSEVFSPDQEFKVTRGEMVLQNHGSYIVFGADRPSSKASGEGGIGASGASSIDIVVGRMASAREGKGSKDGTHVDPSFSADAARIYISQLTKVDTHFGLTGKTLGGTAEQPRSAVAIKADNVRIIGRESIKIITGKQAGVSGFPMGGEPNSLGAKMHQPAPTIELIAGNSNQERYVFGGYAEIVTKISHIQPAVMGDNLKSCLRELAHITSILLDTTMAQTFMTMSSMMTMGLEPFVLFYEYFVYDGATIRPGAAMNDMIESLMNGLTLFSGRIQLLFWELNYLYPFGYKHIVSSNVKLT